MDGQLIDYKGTYFSYTKRIIYHISPFISDSQLNKSRWRPGEYAFASIGNEGGYFVYALPPGKYYIVEIDYLGIVPNNPYMPLAIRTHMPYKGDVKDFYLITFEAVPNQAVYIGTIRHNIKPLKEGEFGYHFSYAFDILDNYEETQKWLLRSKGKYEQYVIKNIAEIIPIQIESHE